MSVLVSNATGNLDASASWLLTRNGVEPSSYSANGILPVDNTHIVYTGYFTPGDAGYKCQGVLLYVGQAPATSNDITCELMEGSTSRASATITFVRDTTANCGPNVGWVFFKFATAYTYGNTDAGTWRFKLSGANTQDVQFRYALGSTTTLAYYEVSDVAQAPANGDCLKINGNGTTAGTFNATDITVNTSLSLGTSAVHAIDISRGGRITYGTSQSASTTLSLTNNLYLFSAEPDVYCFEMGTLANPLTSDYVQTIEFVNAAADRESNFCISDSSFYSYNYNATPPNISLYGNYEFNLASQDNYFNTLASDVEIGGTSIVFTDDLGLRAGGGDVVILGSSEGRLQAEEVTTSAYNPATKTATIGATIRKHSAGSYIWVMNCNAVFKSSSTYDFGCLMGSIAQTYAPVVNINNVEFQYVNAFNSNLHSDSSIDYCRLFFGSGNFGFNYLNTSHIVRFSPDGFTLHGVGATHSNHSLIDVSKTGAPFASNMSFSSDLMTLNDFIMDGCHPSLYTGGIKIIVNRLEQYAGSNGLISSSINYASEFHYCDIGVRVTNSSRDISPGTSIANLLINNCQLGSTNKILDSDVALLNVGSVFRFQKFNDTDNDHRIYQPEGVIRTSGSGLDDTTTRTSGTYCITFLPYTSHANSAGYLNWTQTKAVKANQSVVIQGYMRKNSSWGSASLPNVTLSSSDGEIDTSATMTDVDDTWEFFSLSGQVGASDTYIEIKYEADVHNASAAAYFADIMLIIGDTTAGSATGFMCSTLWKGGEPVADDVLGGTVDATFLENAVWDAQSSDHTDSGSFGKQSTDTRIDVNNQGLLP